VRVRHEDRRRETAENRLELDCRRRLRQNSNAAGIDAAKTAATSRDARAVRPTLAVVMLFRREFEHPIKGFPSRCRLVW
jgi:hypothetical protein